MVTAIARGSIPEVARPDGFRCVACGYQSESNIVVAAEPPARPFDLARCDDCGLVQQFPRWSAGRIAALYGEDYYVFSESDESRWARAVQLYLVHLKKLEEQWSVTPSHDPAAPRLLDVGCALGHLLSVARARGWRAAGLDLSAEAVSQAASRFGLDVRGGSLARHRETLARFDAVMLGDVIEHVPEPVRFMEDVHHVLAPGGVVCIDTPNWGGRWRRSGKKNWIGINRFHINLFDSECLSRLLSKSGFEVVSLGSYTHYRYETWGQRPEVRGWLRWVPRFLAWRIERYLGDRRAATPWSGLRDEPPADLESAVQMVDDWKQADGGEPGHLDEDNLIVTARRMP